MWLADYLWFQIYLFSKFYTSFMLSLHVSNVAISDLRPKALGAAAGEHHDECQGADAPAL
jgi:hypothetical protein